MRVLMEVLKDVSASLTGLKMSWSGMGSDPLSSVLTCRSLYRGSEVTRYRTPLSQSNPRTMPGEYTEII